MTTKVIEVLTKILDGLNKKYSLEDVGKNLASENKFDKQTVSAAFSLVHDKIVANRIEKNIEFTEQNRNIRILCDEEIDAIGVEYYSYLIHLQNIGLIDSSDFEILLEQILLFPTNNLTLEDINWMILLSLVDYDARILPGSRVTLFSSDTIN
ncbi:MAG: DUF494 domain-containing protein [Melioribacteraceae bacterium]|nr:DUF494 domain-containing protein [Melioribacteraceae bacterium]